MASCIMAACARCGALPLYEDTGMTPHFTGVEQAAEELTQNWGWHREGSGLWPVLLCPGCAASRGKEAGPWPG
jgi:hypothetical protein